MRQMHGTNHQILYGYLIKAWYRSIYIFDNVLLISCIIFAKCTVKFKKIKIVLF